MIDLVAIMIAVLFMILMLIFADTCTPSLNLDMSHSYWEWLGRLLTNLVCLILIVIASLGIFVFSRWVMIQIHPYF